MMATGAQHIRRPVMMGAHNKISHDLMLWSAQDFDVAHRRGRLNRFLRKMMMRPNKLTSLGELVAACQLGHQSDRGLHVVALKDIVGTVGRHEDFDHAFLPIRNHTKQRWIRINLAYYMDKPLPPVELIQVGNQYLVSDGHHRISVARSHGQAYLEAHVVHLDVRCNVRCGEGDCEQGLCEEQSESERSPL